MHIEEAGGSNPKKLADAIHDQLRPLGIVKGRVPVEEIATALDIDEIRRLQTHKAVALTGWF